VSTISKMKSVSSSHFEIVFPLFPLSLLPSDRLYPPSSRNHLPQSSFYHLQVVRRICYTLPLPRPFEDPLANYLVDCNSTTRSAQKGSTGRRTSQGLGLSCSLRAEFSQPRRRRTNGEMGRRAVTSLSQPPVGSFRDSLSRQHDARI